MHVGTDIIRHCNILDPENAVPMMIDDDNETQAREGMPKADLTCTQVGRSLREKTTESPRL